jgi:hypothetical protein
MKRLNKMKINPERLMKNEELIALKGGVNCVCTNSHGDICAAGSDYGDCSTCEEMCNYAPGCSGGGFICSHY